MTASLFKSPRAGVALLVAASVALSLGFACAVPLAAFAALAAMRFARRDALFAVFAVWFANQLVGFTLRHYPVDSTTLAWGVALGMIALLACEAARMTYAHLGGLGAFLAAFAAYEGAIIAIDVAIGASADYYAPATVTRIFLINASAFGALWAATSLRVKSKQENGGYVFGLR